MWPMASGITPRARTRKTGKTIWQLLPVGMIPCLVAAKTRNARLITPSESKKKKSKWRNKSREWRRTRQSKQHLLIMDWRGELLCQTLPLVTRTGEKISLLRRVMGHLSKCSHRCKMIKSASRTHGNLL